VADVGNEEKPGGLLMQIRYVSILMESIPIEVAPLKSPILLKPTHWKTP
jgi:hypothetical protein